MSTGLKANSDGSAAIQVGGTDVIELGSTGNINFPVSGQRITGDFSNATLANRVMFQTSTVNGVTAVSYIPNGTATDTYQVLYSGTDVNNTSGLLLRSAATQAQINAFKAGTGTYLPMTFQTGGTESMRLSATSKALILAGGDTTANGTGITFPATQSASSDANTLDDYEEGTWTPTITAETGTYTTVTSSGSYVKVGNAVTVRIRVDIGNNGTAATRMRIAGFPFAAVNTTAISGATREDQAVGTCFIASSIGTTTIVVNRYDAVYGLGTGYGFTLCITYVTS